MSKNDRIKVNIDVEKVIKGMASQKSIKDAIKVCFEFYRNMGHEFPVQLKWTDVPVEFDVKITDDEGIRGYNKEFRGIDEPTDVLSFPSFEYKFWMGVFPKKEDVDESGYCHMGDIVISAETIIRQAKEYGRTVQEETQFMIVHSFLHLAGYDHQTEEERETMEKAEIVFMNNLGYLDFTR